MHVAQPQASGSVMALDVGSVRIGVAVASRLARLSTPLVTIANDSHTTDVLQKIIDEQEVDTIVVGLPRGLDGQETSQTAFARLFAKQLSSNINLPIHFQDEAGTSVGAEEELRSKKTTYTKKDIDMLAATYILEDYLGTMKDPA